MDTTDRLYWDSVDNQFVLYRDGVGRFYFGSEWTSADGGQGLRNPLI
jgi:hypothetical protein